VARYKIAKAVLCPK